MTRFLCRNQGVLEARLLKFEIAHRAAVRGG
jgi:hypothetical protein